VFETPPPFSARAISRTGFLGFGKFPSRERLRSVALVPWRSRNEGLP
jgi:hypothetical protein